MKFTVITLGCKVNQYESEIMRESLIAAGYAFVPEAAQAEIVIVNSCTVTSVSDSKAMKLMRRIKRESPDCITVLTGCMPQAFPESFRGFEYADIIMGNKCRNDLLPLLEQYLKTGERLVKILPHKDDVKFEKMQVQSSFGERTRAVMKIEDGCNRFCSYCIIPYARGRVRSKSIEDIGAEAQLLAEKGYREIVLVGINLSAYGSDIGGINLADAIEAVCAVENIDRVRLGSLEPERLDKEMILRLSRLSKLCPQFHLSLQSGCDQTLKRMNRHYTSGEYMEIVGNLREHFENCSITTDVMVGFPGETEEEFEASLKFVKKVGFSRVHTFAYSRRPGTVADSAKNQVAKKDKDIRSKKMIECANLSRIEFLQTQLGRAEEVLFETRNADGLFEGYTPNYTQVYLKTDEDLSNKILSVKLTEILGEGCLGSYEPR